VGAGQSGEEVPPERINATARIIAMLAHMVPSAWSFSGERLFMA